LRALRSELVSFAADGLYAPWALRIIELLAQPRDMHIRGARRDFAVVLPNLLKNFFARQHAIAVQNEIFE